jgi:hypothetical protein
MENGFLTTVFAGVIVALIGGIIAFYFGGVREKQKLVDQREKELNERRFEAVDAMRPRVRSVGNAFRNWTEKVMKLKVILPESLPAEKDSPALRTLQQSITALSAQLAEIREQAEGNRNDMTSLWNFYEERRPYLEDTTRHVIESFAKDFETRHTSVVNALAADPTVGAKVDLDPSQRETFRKMYADMLSDPEMNKAEKAAVIPVVTFFVAPFSPFLVWDERKKWKQERQEHWEQVRQVTSNHLETVKEAAEHAHDWNLQAHFDAFDAEAVRLVNAAP